MIARIAGMIVEKFAGSLIVDVSGVGYEVAVPTLEYESLALDQEVKLHTYHHIREQSQELFGFSTLSAKKLFEMLITVQGVGPKAGLSILSLGPSENVRNAIANSDSAYIQQAVGIGKKTAERVIVDLADKVGLPTSFGRREDPIQTELDTSDEALEALIALGYTLHDATKALEGVSPDLPTSKRVTEALRK